MVRDFTTDDRGKRVVTEEDRRVGTVSRVDDGRAYVEHDENDDEGLTDKVKSWLGWNDDSNEHELRNDHVDRIDDDHVRLRRRQ